MELKFICSNIRFENDNDAPQLWAKRKYILKNIIENFSPDILATQEGRKPQHESLRSILKIDLIDSHRKWIEERMYPCFYVNLKNIEILDSGDFWLSETPHVAGSKLFNSAFPRLCTWIKIKHLKEKVFYLFNVHLDHIAPDVRETQTKILISEIKKINKENIEIFLMGDFNENPSSTIHHSIEAELNLKDGWIINNNPEEASHHGFKGVNNNNDRIDWIFIPNNFMVKEIYFDKTCENEIFPSDHYPLVATVIPN